MIDPINADSVLPRALLRWLEQHIEGFCGPVRLERLAGGQSNPTFKLETPTASYVLRSKPGRGADLLPSAHALEREFGLLRALRGSRVPVPRALRLCEDESVLGRVFYVMDLVPGSVWWDQSLPDMGAASRGKVYDQMNMTLSALHSVNYKELRLEALERPGNYLERQIGRWSKQYLASVHEPLPTMRLLMDWLPSNLPVSARDPHLKSLVHGDFRLDNLMFDSDSLEVRAVLDWELATIGHPIADFAYHCMSWYLPKPTFRGIEGLDLASLGIPSLDTYIRRYCERTKFVSWEQLAEEWPFYMAFNLFKSAAILQGVVHRAEVGIAADRQAGDFAKDVSLAANLAWSFARSPGRRS